MAEMTDQGFRFCPRCGTALVDGMRYCGKCGFDVEALAEGSAETSLGADQRSDGSTMDEVGPSRRGLAPEPEKRRSLSGSIILAALIIAAGLIGYGLLTRPQGGQTDAQSVGGSPDAVSLAPGATPMPSPPIVGMTIQTPRDGDEVATQEVTVIGLAPPGLTITRDISLFPDQHAAVDSTGHWAIAVRLDQGENTLVFRIGDDRSTEQRIRVTFTPPAQ
jgi:hypothetical protein